MNVQDNWQTESDNRSVGVLRHLQRRLWNEHKTETLIVLGLGDVPALTRGNGVQVVAVDGIDVWRNGDLSAPDVSEDEAINALTKGPTS